MSPRSPISRLALLATAAITCLSAAHAAPRSTTQLTLASGWSTNPGSATPAVMSYHGIVHLIGAIKGTGSAGDAPFTLPDAFLPASNLAIKVDMCNGANGWLVIFEGGVQLQSEDGNSATQQCFTSLDGATYALSPEHYQTLRLRHGWQEDFIAAAPAAHAFGGVVHFQGDMDDGTRSLASILPMPMRPAATVYLPVSGVNTTNGVAIITSDGQVNIQGEDNFNEMKNYTSLDGSFFALDATGFTPLSLVNGWTNSSRGTATPAARVSHSIVEFQGGMSTAGTNNAPFVLPANMRPSHHVDVPVNMCNANNGRLDIGTDGTVLVQSQTQSNAYCFTSLDGVSFHL